MAIIIFILILTLLILVHELGHFIVAKKSGVLVEEFGIGLPPRIFGKKIGETLYSLNLIPFGGFVKLYGEEYAEFKNKKGKKKLAERAFVNKKPWQKALIAVGGVIGNFILAWILISFLFTQGVPTPTNRIIVEKVQKNSPAFLSGIKKGDIIEKISPTKKGAEKEILRSSSKLISLTKKYAGKKIILFIKRDKKELKLELTPRKNPPKNQGSLGVVISSFQEKKYPWYQAPFFGLVESFRISRYTAEEIGKALFSFITKSQKNKIEVAGPVGIARYTQKAIKFGKNAVLEFIALLSLNLAIINLIPFPALDGGRLAFIIYEWITKKRVNPNFERNINLAGFVILLVLAGVITVNDIINIYK